jgi:hypothetical protein
MSAQAPLKEKIEDECPKGSANDERAKGAGNDESAKGSGNDGVTVQAFNNPASTRQERFLAYKGAVEKIIRNSGILLPPTEERNPPSQECERLERELIFKRALLPLDL